MLTDTRLLPSQQERAAASAAVNTLLTPRTTASPGAAPSTLPPDVLTTSAPALPTAPPSAASPLIAQGTASAAVNTLLTDTHMLPPQQGKGAASATAVTTSPRISGNKVMATQNDDIVLCRHGYRCNCIWGCHEGTPWHKSVHPRTLLQHSESYTSVARRNTGDHGASSDADRASLRAVWRTHSRLSRRRVR